MLLKSHVDNVHRKGISEHMENYVRNLDQSLVPFAHSCKAPTYLYLYVSPLFPFNHCSSSSSPYSLEYPIHSFISILSSTALLSLKLNSYFPYFRHFLLFSFTCLLFSSLRFQQTSLISPQLRL